MCALTTQREALRAEGLAVQDADRGADVVPDISAADLSAASDQNGAEGAIGGHHVPDQGDVAWLEDAQR